MKYCEYCGSENNTNRERCISCGANFSKDTIYVEDAVKILQATVTNDDGVVHKIYIGHPATNKQLSFLLRIRDSDEYGEIVRNGLSRFNVDDVLDLNKEQASSIIQECVEKRNEERKNE